MLSPFLAEALQVRYSPEYNCADFVSDILGKMYGTYIPVPTTSTPAKHLLKALRGGFIRIPSPVDGCVVLVRTKSLHVGLYFSGKDTYTPNYLLHNAEGFGGMMTPITEYPASGLTYYLPTERIP